MTNTSTDVGTGLDGSDDSRSSRSITGAIASRGSLVVDVSARGVAVVNMFVFHWNERRRSFPVHSLRRFDVGLEVNVELKVKGATPTLLSSSSSVIIDETRDEHIRLFQKKGKVIYSQDRKLLSYLACDCFLPSVVGMACGKIGVTITKLDL